MSESKVNLPAHNGRNLWAYIAGIICSACVFLGSLFVLWQSVHALLAWQGILPFGNWNLFGNVNVAQLFTVVRVSLILSAILAILSFGALVFLLVRMLIKCRK